MYCRNCGQKLEESHVCCPSCGANLKGVYVSPTDAPSKGFAVLGFFLPIVGLILYLIYEHESPKKARSAGKGALIGLIVYVVLSILSIILYAVCAAVLFIAVTAWGM